MDPLSISASIIAILGATSSTIKTIQHFKNLPNEFEEVKHYLPLANNTLCLVQSRLANGGLSKESSTAIVPILEDCLDKAEKLEDIFSKVATKRHVAIYSTTLTRLSVMGKARQVETLMQKLVKGVQAVALNDAFRTSTESQVAGLQKAIDKLALVQSSVPDSSFSSQNNHFNQTSKTQHDNFSIPFSIRASKRIDDFIGREKELANIHKRLQKQNTRCVVAVHGLGGMGKTQLALEYATKHKNDYTAIFWLHANDKQSIRQSFVKVARQIRQAHPSGCALNAKDDVDEPPDKAVEFVCRWLSLTNNTEWLLICDNYDNPKVKGNKDPDALDLCDFLPEADHGSILITTRVARAGIGHPLPVGRMNEAESLAVLSTTSGQVAVADDVDAMELVKTLGGLPLALASAGSYLQQVQTSFKEYLELYNEQWSELQMSNELDNYDFTLYTTWQLSYKHVQQQNSLSANLLRWWAYFDHRDIWYELLQECKEDVSTPPWILQLVSSKLAFDAAARVLTNHGLIEKDNSAVPGGYSMHPCVHAWTCYVLNTEFDNGLAWSSVFCLLWSFFREPNLPKRVRLTRHAGRCLSLAPVATGSLKQRLLSAARICHPDIDGSVSQLVLHEQKKTLGPDIRLAQYVESGLTSMYKRMRELDAAKKKSQWILASTAAGPDDPAIAKALSELGSINFQQGQYDAAETNLLRALSGLADASEQNQKYTEEALYLLACLHCTQGKLYLDEAMSLRVLKMFDMGFNSVYPRTLLILGLTWAMYRSLGKDNEANALVSRILDLVKRSGQLPALAAQLGALHTQQIELDKTKQVPPQALIGQETATDTKQGEMVLYFGMLGVLYMESGDRNTAFLIHTLIQGYMGTTPAQSSGNASADATKRLIEFVKGLQVKQRRWPVPQATPNTVAF